MIILLYEKIVQTATCTTFWPSSCQGNAPHYLRVLNWKVNIRIKIIVFNASDIRLQNGSVVIDKQI